MAGYDPKIFNSMLNGKRNIQDNDIPPIANALGVTPNELFGFEDQKSYVRWFFIDNKSKVHIPKSSIRILNRTRENS